MQMTREQWYKMKGLKHITGFISPKDRKALKALAKAADQSLSKYVTRLIEKHIRDQQVKPPPPPNPSK